MTVWMLLASTLTLNSADYQVAAYQHEEDCEHHRLIAMLVQPDKRYECVAVEVKRDFRIR